MVDHRFPSPEASRVAALPRPGSSIWGERARRLSLQGKKIFPLAGTPVEPLPPHIVEAGRQAIQEAYSPPSAGLPELREALAEMLASEAGREVTPEEILVTPGGMQAAYVVFTSLVDIGDEIIIPSPCFFFHDMLRLIGGVPILAPMSEEAGYRFDLDRIADAITPKTKAILVNTPVNPTGYMVTQEDLMGIADMAEAHDLTIISDESFDKFVYDGRKHRMMAALTDAYPRTITIRSFTKSYGLPPWRVGYVFAPRARIDVCRKVLEWMILTSNYVSQRVALAALQGPQDWLAGVREKFQRNRDLLWEGLNGIGAIPCVKPQGGPFLFPNVSRFSLPEEELAWKLLEDHGIPTTPGTYFDAPGHLRIPFGGITDAQALNLVQRVRQAAERYA